MSKIKLRENLMKIVFQYNLTKNENCDYEMLDKENLTEEDKMLLNDYFIGIKENYSDIINTIETNLYKFKLDRICKTDLAILIVAIYEMKYLKQPYKVVINEAVELSKKYSNDNSYKFVNGLLAKVVDAI